MAVATPYLDVLSQAFADELSEQPPIDSLPINEFRALLEELQAHTPDSSVTRTSFTVPFEDGVKTFVFKPANTPKGVVLPVVFFIHGGAWVAGSVNTHDSLVRDICKQTGFAVVFPEYTLAPEAQFPSQQEQCYAVIKWVSEHGRTKGLRQSGFAIASDSAGGQLTVATTILCSTRKPLIPVLHQTLLHPILNTNLDDRLTRSEFTFFNGPFITVPLLRNDIDLYVPVEAARDTELASPLLISKAHARLQPSTLIVNSSADVLRDDGKLFGQVLQRAGVECAVFTAHGQLHDTEVLEATRAGETPRVVVRMVAQEIRLAIGDEAGTNGKEAKKRAAEEDGVSEDVVEVKTNGAAKKRRRTRRS